MTRRTTGILMARLAGLGLMLGGWAGAHDIRIPVFGGIGLIFVSILFEERP